MLTILPSSSTRAIWLTSLAIYCCIPLKAIQYYIIIVVNRIISGRLRAWSGPRYEIKILLMKTHKIISPHGICHIIT